jgi:tetratricopeptide (TPR) repeat protein
MLEVSERLIQRFPDQPSTQRLRVVVLAMAERWDEAIAAMDEYGRADDPATLETLINILVTGERYADAVVRMRRLEGIKPSVVDDRYWNNNFAWSLFMAHGDDPSSVKAGLKRVHRELKRDSDDRVVRNTLAFGLYLDGRYVQAERTLSDIMVGRNAKAKQDDVYLHLLTLLALGRDDEAMKEYREFIAEVPEGGELKERAIAEFVEKGLLPPSTSRE